MDRHIQAPLLEDEIKDLKAGDYVYITGTIYTARDAAHKRMQETLDALSFVRAVLYRGGKEDAFFSPNQKF